MRKRWTQLMRWLDFQLCFNSDYEYEHQRAVKRR
jgi:hypothetical protein